MAFKPEFTAKCVREWLDRVGVKTLLRAMDPGSSWENGSTKSLNGKLRDELLNRETYTLLEVKVLIKQ